MLKKTTFLRTLTLYTSRTKMADWRTWKLNENIQWFKINKTTFTMHTKNAKIIQNT